MRVHLTLLSGEEAVLTVSPDTTVHDLKLQAQRELGIHELVSSQGGENSSGVRKGGMELLLPNCLKDELLRCSHQTATDRVCSLSRWSRSRSNTFSSILSKVLGTRSY